MNDQENSNFEVEDYDTPKIVGEIDTIEEEIEYLEKKVKVPVWMWLVLIIAVSVIALMVTSGQSPTLIFSK